MLIAEDLLLLLTDDEKGTVRRSDTADYVLAGALLIELTLAGRVRITEKGESNHKPNRVTVVDPGPTDDDILDDALQRLTAKDRDCRPEQAVELLVKNVRKPLFERLAGRGLLREHTTKVLGLFPHTTWPAVEADHEADVRAGIFRVLVHNEEPTVAQASLISLLSALEVVDKVVAEDVSTIDRKAVKERAKHLLEENWASAGARAAIRAVEDAATAAAFIAISVATSGN